MSSPIRRPLLPLMLNLVLAGPALAETSPYYLGVNQAISYDTNPARQPDAVAQSSWWSSTSLVGGIDQRYGRQHFYANGNVAANLYGQLDQLDNTSYGLTAGWDWATIERLSGQLYAAYNEGLANYGGFNQANLFRVVKVTQASTLAYGRVEYGLVSLLAADLRLAYSSNRYDSEDRVANALFSPRNLDQGSVTVRVRKEFSGQLTLGTGLSYTRGDYFSVDRQFDRYDAFVLGIWEPTGQSTVSGRIGYSSWDYTGANPYDQSGVTGWVRWVYTPTGKLTFDTLLSYDTLANSSLTDVGGGTPGGQGDTNRLTAGLQFTATYAVTGKTSLNASLQYFARTEDFLINPPPGQPPTPAEARDRVTNLSLGATWLPARNWQVNCNLTLNDRNQSSDSSAVTLTPYTAYGGSCAVQFLLQ
ncbi:MAG: hypothetical protein J0L57_04205 [Burkholderiales bacterium]|nr:hypothetical protein [Burkholderiales bacterium]